jgi:hypothetical protein
MRMIFGSCDLQTFVAKVCARMEEVPLAFLGYTVSFQQMKYEAPHSFVFSQRAIGSLFPV